VWEAQDGGLLAAMLCCGAREDAPDFADELALGPEAARCVEELTHLARHVPEPGRRAEDDGAGISQVIDGGDGHIGEAFWASVAPMALIASGGRVSGTR